MRFPYPAVAAIAILVTCNPASAQSTSDILRRLDVLEKNNADLNRENAALRDRVRRIESAKRTTTATPAAPSPTNPAAIYASASTAPVYKAEPLSAPAAWSWTGFYVGAHGGFARAQTTGPNLGITEQGGFGGIQMGLNYQFSDHWVVGVEQDASFGDITGSTPNVGGATGTATMKLDAFGTFRERIGYTWDRVMFYETAGIAWAHANPTNANGPPNPEVLNDHRLMTGLAAGGGIEVAATSNLTVKAEYLFLDFPDKNFFSGTDLPVVADQHIHTVKVGVNWLLH
jgi:opacity protein-like surface antigen